MTSDPIILGFDTSGPYCAAALIKGPLIISNRHDDMARGQAEHLFPMLEEMLLSSGSRWQDLSAIGVGIGPGNFTGIRISVAAARGLSLSLGIPAVGVTAFDAASLGVERPVTAVVDARRDRVYARDYPGEAPVLVTLDDLRAAHVTGPAAEIAAQHCGADIRQSPYPVAEAIARVARQRFPETSDPPAPLYIRPADAAPARDLPPVILDDA
ncbi:tRNA (adenosine(37)-N6)-threonylcarbamoyltransferase complex dimerization subunit type 1 TsaB [Primorskyibacter aestuariivivens]|uniref:tRNA (adenosine(37)-N6)-threonylcarbamoyltransferase complex dimerization subunit type 1 TsaB n=1 Tax=Primorskyibacter aestuariivivens TaxID=1888912 RepID=UPI00230174CD|nr:tRNA (adenosine(37)-N6)-threonylcarbamoyltransferase complex dimerization subunit type 1 TsaB [Primorskyibacter aestuariivivens]MDA7429324.1 tRNA (adenosine(37)-N6)-threonylcarbamoyltransferase complex dimerization subunit type 1 TsaB [Primorskyibacter aestuariivivens]